jgi:hypothetical protein
MPSQLTLRAIKKVIRTYPDVLGLRSLTSVLGLRHYRWSIPNICRNISEIKHYSETMDIWFLVVHYTYTYFRNGGIFVSLGNNDCDINAMFISIPFLTTIHIYTS